jgi:hypothetical protein
VSWQNDKCIAHVADLICRLGVPISVAAVKRGRRRSNATALVDKPKQQLFTTIVDEQQEPPAVLCGGAHAFVPTCKYSPFAQIIDASANSSRTLAFSSSRVATWKMWTFQWI